MMTMTARERLAEYATLKALGRRLHRQLLFGESLVIALGGGVLGLLGCRSRRRSPERLALFRCSSSRR